MGAMKMSHYTGPLLLISHYLTQASLKRTTTTKIAVSLHLVSYQHEVWLGNALAQDEWKGKW